MTRSLLLAPHNDDAELFACYTLLREKPDVIVVLRSMKQEIDYGITFRTRERETAEAMRIVDCNYEQWAHLDISPNWLTIEQRICNLAGQYDHVYAPAFETDGQNDHNRVASIAADAFGNRATAYLTYTNTGKSTWGEIVPCQPDWPDIKRRALACYRSQIALAGTAPHFTRPLDEYRAPRRTA